MNQFYVYDSHHCPIFEVTRTDTDYMDVSCTFNVRSISSWVENEDGEYTKPYEPEDYMEITIKWDGCAHIYFGDKDEDGSRNCYLHFCGAEDFKRHVRLMHLLYNRAFELMGRNVCWKDEEWNEL